MFACSDTPSCGGMCAVVDHHTLAYTEVRSCIACPEASRDGAYGDDIKKFIYFALAGRKFWTLVSFGVVS